MNLRLIPALLGAAVLLFHDALAQESPTESTRPRSNSSSSPPATTSPSVTTCEQAGLVSVYVVGAPNAFCVQSNTCNSNYIGACPGANAIDVQGVVLSKGSCCASLEGTGEVGCVSTDLIAGDVQCVRHAGSAESAKVIDPATLTPAPTTTSPPPATTSPSPTSQLPSPTPFSELTNEPDSTSSTPVSTSKTPSPVSTTTTPSPLTTTPAQTVIITSMSMSSAGSEESGDENTEPEAGDEPTSAPVSTPPPETVPDLSSLEPITEPPKATAQSNSVVESSGKGNSNSNSNTQSSGSGNASSSSSSFTSFVNSDVVLALVLGSVATVAVILGAFILRRRSNSSITSSSTTSNSVFSRKHNGSDAAPLTLDGDDDLYEDLRFKASDAFSPIQVQPSYAASSTPGHDRPSYFL